MDPDLGKRVMNVVTLAMLVWRLFVPAYEHRSGHDAALEDALLQLSGGSLLTAHGTTFASGYEPYLACALAADATAMQSPCTSLTDRS